MKEKKSISRRKFLKAVTLTGGAAAAGSLLAACAGQPATIQGEKATLTGGEVPVSGGLTLDLSKPENQALVNVGGTVALDANALDPAGIFVVRTGDSTVKAFSRKCTHAGCTVGAYKGDTATCPCHGSQYDQTGTPTHGPAGAPLAKYNAVLAGSIVTIT
jgi:Rieske Fe-S protein